jgi:hypothetical protein
MKRGCETLDAGELTRVNLQLRRFIGDKNVMLMSAGRKLSELGNLLGLKAT